MLNKIVFTIVVIAALFSLICTPAFAGETADLASQEMGIASGAYIIGAGDILEITTWKEEDFSRDEILVRLDGRITFPLLDDIAAQGHTPLQVKEDIQKKLGEYIESPIVTVTVRASASKKFYILGEVMATGEYPLVKDLTVLQAFALAGGFTEWASKKEILLFRYEDGQEKIYRVNYKDIIKGKDFSQNIKIQADDTIIVP